MVFVANERVIEDAQFVEAPRLRSRATSATSLETLLRVYAQRARRPKVPARSIDLGDRIRKLLADCGGGGRRASQFKFVCGGESACTPDSSGDVFGDFQQQSHPLWPGRT